MRCLGFAVAAVLALLLASAATVQAASYQIGPVSQQVSPSTASAGASVESTSASSGAPGSRDVSTEQLGGGEPASSTPSGEEVRGPSRANGEECQNLPATANPCYGVVALPPEEARKAEAAPPINPAALAATAASHLTLLGGQIEASPSSHAAGLTGAASWFWLSPTPAEHSLTVGARGEHVTVTASVAAVRWNFGDGTSIEGGPGIPYQPELSSPAAIRHAYETRCLPGDRGHDPNVSASCGPNGYEVHASVVWGISYQATGPITTSGALPTRSTETTLTYPVTEARAFLTSASER